VTYYAHWTINSYTAVFHTDGTNNGVSVTKNYNVQLGTLPVTEKTGYQFLGWFTSPDGGTQITATTKMGAANADYYARWEPNKWKVVYEANGGTGRMSDSVFSYNGEKHSCIEWLFKGRLSFYWLVEVGKRGHCI